MKKIFFASEQYVSQQIGEKKTSQRNKNLKFKSSQFSRKITPTDSWCCESFTEDHNTTPSTYLP